MKYIIFYPMKYIIGYPVLLVFGLEVVFVSLIVMIVSILWNFSYKTETFKTCKEIIEDIFDFAKSLFTKSQT